MPGFRGTIQYCGFSDLGFVGLPYTWDVVDAFIGRKYQQLPRPREAQPSQLASPARAGGRFGVGKGLDSRIIFLICYLRHLAS
jgi:hypothetical protein